MARVVAGYGDLMRRILAVLIFGVLNGCATAPVDPSIAAAANEPLLCSDKKQCDFYWQRAQIWVTQNSGYRIQSATDTIIATYGPSNSKVELAHQIVRIPNEDGSARITIASGCDNIFGCRPNKDVDTAAFKRYVKTGY